MLLIRYFHLLSILPVFIDGNSFLSMAGMMHFVREWNKEVEISLHASYKTVEMDQKITELESQTNELEVVIAEQDEEIEKIKKRNDELEFGKLWLLQNAEEAKESLKGKLHQIKLREMCIIFLELRENNY